MSRISIALDYCAILYFERCSFVSSGALSLFREHVPQGRSLGAPLLGRVCLAGLVSFSGSTCSSVSLCASRKGRTVQTVEACNARSSSVQASICRMPRVCAVLREDPVAAAGYFGPHRSTPRHSCELGTIISAPSWHSRLSAVRILFDPLIPPRNRHPGTSCYNVPRVRVPMSVILGFVDDTASDP
ncbi:hypothetical protein EXIGLDRAFT_412168 [Exidia glandulosa HHB12029]|uniref:Uncharacterized protein n=1 Tax=Exidia glandulosa HHB12029 TaxID=1314781 RepID=A0A165Z9A8_EXIGL|nr:hypothetical protein EXIGLDRAFT_412168 [Exidia glandulosa HHB12029]